MHALLSVEDIINLVWNFVTSTGTVARCCGSQIIMFAISNITGGNWTVIAFWGCWSTGVRGLIFDNVAARGLNDITTLFRPMFLINMVFALPTFVLQRPCFGTNDSVRNHHYK